MRILDNFGQAFRKGADLQIYGQGGSRRSTRIQRLNASGSHFAYDVEAGPLYDNGVVLPAINWKSNAISEAELTVQQFDAAQGKWVRAKEDGQIKAVLSAFDNPNDYYDGLTMWQGVQLSWDTRGNSYLYIREDNLGRPMGFYWIPHFQIRPMADVGNPDGTKLITRYEYTPFGGQMQYLDPAGAQERLYPGKGRVVQLRYGIDPRDPASGLSPLAAELRDICADNEVSTWIASLVRNGATPGVILSPKAGVDAGDITPKQRKDLADLWKSFVGDKRGDPLPLPLPVDITIPTFSPKDMELGALRDIPMTRIMAALGLDPLVLGFTSEKSTFANKEQAVDDAGKRTILPTMKRWASQCTHQVFPLFKLDPTQYRLHWDTTGVTWLADDTLAKNKGVREDFKAGYIDRYTAKVETGRAADDEDKGVYASKSPGLDGAIDDDKDEDSDAQKAISLLRTYAVTRARN